MNFTFGWGKEGTYTERTMLVRTPPVMYKIYHQMCYWIFMYHLQSSTSSSPCQNFMLITRYDLNYLNDNLLFL